MKQKCLHDSDGQRTYAVVLESGEEVMSCLQNFVAAERIYAAQVSGVGAFSDVLLQYFDWGSKKYLPIPVREQVEAASFLGDVAQAPSGEPAVHVHLVIGRSDGSAMAGHLAQAHVRPTLELIITESPVHLRKHRDAESGLALIQLDA